jgi:kynureninase
VTLHRTHAKALDRADALAGFREHFVLSDPLRIYADGNSLGRLPHETVERIEALVREWGDRLVGGWEEWIELPVRIGDEIGDVIGARPGETLACDSTTITSTSSPRPPSTLQESNVHCSSTSTTSRRIATCSRASPHSAASSCDV